VASVTSLASLGSLGTAPAAKGAALRPLGLLVSAPAGHNEVMASSQTIVVAHRPAWEQQADDLRATLRDQLGETAARIEHIGSTSITGMPAKDVIDLQISVFDLDRSDTAFGPPLAHLGFERSPHQFDHVPAGQPDDPAEWEKRLWLRRGSPPGDVNLHVRRIGSPNERLALLFRDWFRAHPGAVPAYGAFKCALAGIVPDTALYSDVKDPVVDLVIVVAGSWAASTGWQV